MRESVSWTALGLSLLFVACGSSDKKNVDAGPDYPAWNAGHEPAATAIGVRRGLTPQRGIIHLHSPLSHDACDGAGIDETTGVLDESCLADLRAALCTTRVDFAALTDHDDFMAEQDFTDTYLLREDDELVLNASGDAVASRIHCDNGHQLMWSVGGENDLMPVMLDRHPEGSVDERKTSYNSGDAAAATLFRELGGLTLIAHTEDKDIDYLRTVGLDGLEIYNLHANLDPTIRKDFLGLDGPAGLRNALKFAEAGDTGPEPDLAFLGFLEPSDVALQKWDTLLGEGQRLVGTAGTDAHQNALPIEFRDGERGDSYRRMIRWFSNIVLVSETGNHEALQEALGAGRSYVAFEIMGTPAGLDVRASAAGKPTVEIGGELAVNDGYTLEVTTPSVYQLDERLPVPDLRVSILHVDATGTREVATANTGSVTAPMDKAGAYRVEIYITPRHLTPYLAHLAEPYAEREFPWVYANPIYVVPAAEQP